MTNLTRQEGEERAAEPVQDDEDRANDALEGKAQRLGDRDARLQSRLPGERERGVVEIAGDLERHRDLSVIVLSFRSFP